MMVVRHSHRQHRQLQLQQQQCCFAAKVITFVTVALLLLASGVPMVQAGGDKDVMATPNPTLSTQLPTSIPMPLKETPPPTMPPKETPKPPTIQPTPASDPVAAPSPTGPPTETVAVALPQMRFVLEATGPLDEQEVDSAVVEFFNYFFMQGFYRDAFLDVTLQTSLVNGVETRRKTMRRFLTLKPKQRGTNRKLAAAEMVALDVHDGTAMYDANAPTSDGKPAPVPTEEALYDILLAYFSLWGAEKLLEYFQNDGLPIASISQVVLDGKAIKVEDDQNNGGDDGDDGNDSGTNKVGIVAGSVAGAAALIIVAAAILVHIQRRKKKTQREVDSHDFGDNNNNSNNQTTKMPVSSKSDLSVSESEGAPPPLPQPTFSGIPVEYLEKTANPYADNTAAALSMAPTRTTSEDDQDSVSESDGDIISVTESLHHQHDRGPSLATGVVNTTTNFTDSRPLALTGKASVRQPPPTVPQSNFQYDASRLDQVISDAKKQGLLDK